MQTLTLSAKFAAIACLCQVYKAASILAYLLLLLLLLLLQLLLLLLLLL